MNNYQYKTKKDGLIELKESELRELPKEIQPYLGFRKKGKDVIIDAVNSFKNSICTIDNLIIAIYGQTGNFTYKNRASFISSISILVKQKVLFRPKAGLITTIDPALNTRKKSGV